MMVVLDGSQRHRFEPPDQALEMRTRTADGVEMGGRVFPHKVDDSGSTTWVELQGSGNLIGHQPD